MLVAPDWEPQYVDYFYLAFTNATAFSPTDSLPVTLWAKMLMLAQSAIADCASISILAHRVTGKLSVGLKAVALVKAR